MIDLESISHQLEEMLNHSVVGVDKPTHLMSYQFGVRTQGYFFQKVADFKTGKNFIPVFVGSLGGTINPIPNLGEVDYNIPITIYFPVRFKNDMFYLQDFLYDLFVGQVRSYGTKQALSNISIPQIGEIQYLDLKEFKQWVNDTYKRDIQVSEAWLSLSFNLYLSTANDVGNNGFIYGNSWKTYIYITEPKSSGSPTEIATLLDPTFVEITDSASSEPAAEQLLGTKYTKGVATATSYSRQITLYVTGTSFKTIIDYYMDRKLQGLTFSVNDVCSELNINKTRSYYIVGCELKKAKGSLMTMTFTLADII